MLPPLAERMLSPSQHLIKEAAAINVALPTPRRIIVREITMDVGAQGFTFKYRRPDKHNEYSDLDKVLRRLRKGHWYDRKGLVDEYHRVLDLNLVEPSCVIFFLSDDWNWRFSRKSMGVTLGELEYEDDYNAFWDLRHVAKNEADSPKPFSHGHKCRVVYFNAHPTRQSFRHAFNLNVEILGKDKDDEPNTLPIVIDPDIRNPGGSES